MRHNYRIEVLVDGGWRSFAGGECGREYGMGYLAAWRLIPGPRFGLRLVRSDGKVLDEAPALDDVSIGMVAGWPTAEQYRAAAARAIAKAEAIEQRGGR